MAANDKVNVKVWSPGVNGDSWKNVELSIIPDVTVRQAISDVVGKLSQTFTEKNPDAENPYVGAYTWAFSTSSLGNEFLDSDDTLREQDVHDGDALYLISNPAKESSLLLEDDMSVAIVDGTKKNFPEWDTEGSRRVARALAPAMVAVLSLIGIWIGCFTGITWWAKIPLAVGFFLAGVVALAFTVPVMNTRHVNDPTRKSGTSSAVATYLLFAASGFLMIPGEVTAYNAICSGVLLIAASVALRSFLVDGLESLNIGALGFGTILTIAGAVMIGLDSLPNVHVTGMMSGAILGLVSILVLIYSVESSISLVRLPMPYVPPVGASFIKDSTPDLTDIHPSADAEAVKNLINAKAKITGVWRARIGLVAAGSIGVTLSTAIMAAYFNGDTLAAVLALSIPACAFFVAMSDMDLMLRTVSVIGAFCSAAALPVILLMSDTHTEYVGPFSVILLLAVVFGVVLSSRDSTNFNPKITWIYQFIQGVIIVGMFVEIALLLDVFGSFRN